MKIAKKKLSRMSERKLFYIFVSPWLIGLVLFTLGPMVFSMVLAFTSWNMIQPIEWVGISNFRTIFTDDRDFWLSLRATFIWASFLPVGIILALFLANFLNKKIRAIPVFRTIIYIPTIVPAVVNSFLWLWIFNPEFGMANMMLGWFGIPGLRWLLSPNTAMISLIIMSLWQVGGNTIIFLAALQNVPKDIIEASDIDGASSIVKYFRITLPMISPMIFFQFIMGIIGALQVFTPAFLMTGGGPGPTRPTFFYILYLYQVAFVRFDMGYASALAWILFGITLILTLLVFKFLGRKIYYEAD